MGSKVSKAKRPATTDTKPVIIPIIPQDTIPKIPHDIVNEILDHLAGDSDLRSLRACALVSKSWAQPCRRHLSHTALFTPTSARGWLKTFPVREESPAHYVRDLRLKMEVNSRIPNNFFECLPWFTDVDRMSLSGHGMIPLTEPSSWKLPRSVTSLTINSPLVTLAQVRDIMLQLPNLDDLALTPDSLAKPNERMLPGNRTALKGRFCG